MAKKARRRLEEADDDKFEFPEFDERLFLAHEFEQYYATVLAFILGLIIGAAAFLVGRSGLPVALPLLTGVVGVAGGTFAIQRIRPASSDYTKGDWAGLILLMIFGFLGFWLLFSDLFRSVGFG